MQSSVQHTIVSVKHRTHPVAKGCNPVAHAASQFKATQHNLLQKHCSKLALLAGSFASVARSEASFMSSVGGSRSKEQALADTYARACARLKALEVQFHINVMLSAKYCEDN